MEPITLLLASLFGPVFLALGIGFLINAKYYSGIYAKIHDQALVLMIGGVASLVLGILIVTNHSLWGNAVEVIISLLGWSALIKGSLLLACPQPLVKAAQRIICREFIMGYGVVMIGFGALLSYLVYLT